MSQGVSIDPKFGLKPLLSFVSWTDEKGFEISGVLELELDQSQNYL